MTVASIGRFHIVIPDRPPTPPLPSPKTPPTPPSPPPPSPSSKKIDNDMIIPTATSPSLTDSLITDCSNAKEERLETIDKIIHAINEMKRVQYETSLAITLAIRDYLENDRGIRR